MTAPPALLFGFSHVAGIKVAQARRVASKTETFRLETFQLIEKYLPVFGVVDGAAVLQPDIEPDLRRKVEALQPQCIFGAFWANQNFFYSTANMPRRMDFVLPSEPDLPLDEQAELVPYDLIYDLLRLQFRYAPLLIEATRRVCSAPLCLIKAPPPMFDFGAIPGASSGEHLDRLIAEHGVTPPHLRYKFWRLVEGVHQEVADTAAVPVLPIPPESQRPNGFLRPEYHGIDWIHAGPDYGELVLKQCDALISVEGA